MIFVFPPLRHLDCSYSCEASIMYDTDDVQNYKCTASKTNKDPQALREGPNKDPFFVK